jgi:hypothetical protein
MERLKRRAYQKIYTNTYFWRSYRQQEIDLIEERDGMLYGYEFKWSNNKLPRVPSEWATTYPDATYEVVSPDNYLDFVAPPSSAELRKAA